MKRIKRIAAAITLVSFMLLNLTACAEKDKLELLGALEKTAGIQSWESQGSFRISKAALDTNIEALQSIQPLLAYIEGMELNTHQKTVRNSELTRVKAQSDMTVHTNGTAQNMSVWADMDLTQQPPVVKQIVKLPSILAGSLPDGMQGKEYMVLNQSGQAGMDQVMGSANDLQTRLMDIVKKYAASQGTEFIVVTQQPDRIVNGRKHTVYQLKLTDASLKIILKALLTDIPDNQEVKNLIKEFMIAVIGLSSGSEGGQDLANAFDALRDGSTSFKEDLSRLGSVLEDVRILGNEGVVINFMVSPEGYIVNQNGIMDLYLDTQQVENALEKLANENAAGGEYLKAAAGLTLNFNVDTFKINEDIVIDFPVLTKENSFSLDELTGGAAAPSSKTISNTAKPVSNVLKNNISVSDVYPVRLGSRLFVPLELVCSSLDFEYGYDKQGRFHIKTNKGVIKGEKDSNEIFVDGVKKPLSLPVMEIENQLFATSQFVEDYLDAVVFCIKGTQLVLRAK